MNLPPTKLGPAPPAIPLARVPLTPAACDAFPPEELAARIRAHNRRCHRGRKRKPAPPRCLACNRMCPRGKRVDTAGWHSRRMPGYGTVMECVCPTCWARWGWGDRP